MAKKVFYDDDARSRVLGGAEILYNAVKTTMGPKGRNVVIGDKDGNAIITHDGVTVAKNTDVEDNTPETLGFKVGANLIKKVATKMEKLAGDGTTTVTVLAYNILYEANKLIAAGHNPMLIRRELDAAAKLVIEELKTMAEDIKKNPKRIAEIGKISSGEKAIGDLLAVVIAKVGNDGVITVEEGQGLDLEAEVVEGYSFDRGFISPYMVSDQNRMEAVMKSPAIIVTDKTISSINDFLPLLEKLTQAGRKDIFLIAEDVTPDPLSIFILNKLQGIVNIVAVKAPEYGDRRTSVLEDIAILTGGQVISDATGIGFDEIDLDAVGSARKIIVSKDITTIIEGAGDPSDRIKELEKQSLSSANEYDQQHLDKRRAALSGKIALIKVGGATETEIDERKYRVDDAVAAVKAALDEGIVTGGGITPLTLIRSITEHDNGSIILRKALEQPFRILMQNADINPDEWLPKINARAPGVGVDVNGEAKLIDLKRAGVVDPVRVTREAIQYAVSIAGTAMTMGALVVEVEDAK